MLVLLLFQGPANADRWQASQLSGSSWLLLYSILNERPRGYENATSGLARDLALVDEPGLVGTKFHVAPALEWDGNINGGIPGSTISLGPYRFVVDEDSRARSGIVIGGDVRHEVSWSLGSGTLAELDAGLSYRFSPEYDLDRTSGRIGGCISHVYEAWRKIGACVSVGGTERELSTSVTRRVSVNHLFVGSTAIGDFELGTELFGEDREGIVQAGVALNVLTATDEWGAFGARLTLGEHVEGRSASTASLNVWSTQRIKSQPTSFSLGYHHVEGSRLFDMDRDDDVMTATISRRLTDQISASVRWTNRRSTIDVYDEESVTLGVNIKGWRR
jgi:hypothetical protein